jgi:hypothetical protein
VEGSNPEDSRVKGQNSRTGRLFNKTKQEGLGLADEEKPKKKSKVWWIIGGIVVLLIIIIASSRGCGSSSTSSNSQPSKPATSKAAVKKQRQVTGKATDLGAGTFQGGKDIQAGLYDVTPVGGEGNFTVKSSGGDLKINEVLGNVQSLGVLKVRVKISNGDKIQLQEINKAHFEPVITPFVKTVQALSLYSGRWVVGEDVAAGKYKATPVSGSGNFIVSSKNGMPVTNEILGGDMGVKEVTVNLKDGEIIDIGSINQINFTPTN